MQVIHQPRVAWDTARTIGDALADEALFGWLSHEFDALLGPTAGEALAESRDRVRRAGAARLPVETGLWRVRLEDTLRQRPELAGELTGLAAIARARRS
ncbi:hypothetical protein [Micromonospora sp. WMMD998]|uniref:hypothetical protein n=1 Tax=Micromonospora sp. WMMD998 TaxID=3016092 RepID=UPI00249CC765|nr:hypothetical protein [Micromonospora sp. WMMD998]WFE38726.1 hypothetical protein O7619_09910 [Micromonospora sp. WMMD998]